MRFLSRALVGFGVFAACAFVLAIGARPYLGCAPGLSGLPGLSCAFDRPDRAADRGSAERVFTVRTATLTAETFEPTITAFGEISAGRVLDLSAPLAGRLVALDPAFKEGGWIGAGAVLFRVDPADSESQSADARAALREAEAERAEAIEAAALAAAEYDAAVGQRNLRQSALSRQRDLADRGFTTAVEIEAAELALAEAERAVITRAQARAAADRRVAQAEQQVARAGLSVDDAARLLDDTTVVAPFAGVLHNVDATLGRLVATNEALGSLIDPTRLEASFRVSNSDFARLLDESGGLRPLPVTATLDLGARSIMARGRLDRIGGRVEMAEGGRRVFAALYTALDTVLRPGDFVRIAVEEPPLDAVAITPASALDAQGRLMIVNAAGRLDAVPVTIERRRGDMVALSGAPIGATYVVEPGPHLGPGVRVRPESGVEEGAEDAFRPSGDDAARTGDARLSAAPAKRRAQ